MINFYCEVCDFYGLLTPQDLVAEKGCSCGNKGVRLVDPSTVMMNQLKRIEDLLARIVKD